VTAVTTATEGHAPMRLARGCEPPTTATYAAARLAAAAGSDARHQSCAHQAPAAANSAPPRSRRPVRRATRNPRRGRGRRPQTTGTWECRSWALRCLLVPAGQYHLGPAQLLTRCLRQTITVRSGSPARARSRARRYPPRPRDPSPCDKPDGLIERYNPALGRHEAQLSHELRAVEDESEA
jgi:hypothetical protein